MLLTRLGLGGKLAVAAVLGTAGLFAASPANAAGFRLFVRLPLAYVRAPIVVQEAPVVIQQPTVIEQPAVIQQPVTTAPVYAAPACPAPAIAEPLIVTPAIVPAPVAYFNGGFWGWPHRDHGHLGFFRR